MAVQSDANNLTKYQAHIDSLLATFWNENPGKFLACNFIKLLGIFIVSFIAVIIIRYSPMSGFLNIILLILLVLFGATVSFYILCKYKDRIYPAEITAQINEYKKLEIKIEEYPDMPGIKNYGTLICIIGCVLFSGMLQNYIMSPSSTSDPSMNSSVIVTTSAPIPAPKPKHSLEEMYGMTTEQFLDLYDGVDGEAWEDETGYYYYKNGITYAMALGSSSADLVGVEFTTTSGAPCFNGYVTEDLVADFSSQSVSLWATLNKKIYYDFQSDLVSANIVYLGDGMAIVYTYVSDHLTHPIAVMYGKISYLAESVGIPKSVINIITELYSAIAK